MVGAYNQLLVGNSGRKEALEVKTLASKLKDCFDELSETLSSTTKSIRRLKKTVAVAKKAADQATSKVGALKK